MRFFKKLLDIISFPYMKQPYASIPSFACAFAIFLNILINATNTSKAPIIFDVLIYLIFIVYIACLIIYKASLRRNKRKTVLAIIKKHRKNWYF